MVGGQQGGLITGTADRYNRQLHPKEIDWIEANAEAFAAHLSAQEGRTVSEGEARFRLVQQALKEIDLGMRLTLDHRIDEHASAYLQTAQDTFENNVGNTQRVFTVEGTQYVRPELYLYETDLAYYRENVHPGVTYTPGEGLTAFLLDYKDKGETFLLICRRTRKPRLNVCYGPTRITPRLFAITSSHKVCKLHSMSLKVSLR